MVMYEEIKVSSFICSLYLYVIMSLYFVQWKFGSDGKYSDSKENLATNRSNISNVTLVFDVFIYFLIYQLLFHIQNSNCCCNKKIENLDVNSSSRSESLSRPDYNDDNMPWFHGKITREEAETLLNPREVL